MSKSSLIKGEGLNYQLDNKTILQDINVSLSSGEVLGIIGPNGAGKSSLLKILAGVTQADSGTLKMKGDYYHQYSARQFAEQLAYLEQHASVHWPLLVHKVIELGRIPHQGFSAKLSPNDHQAIDQAVSATGVAPLLNRVVTTLSEGERMLVALCRILASQTQIILADEPVAALDPYHQLLIMEILQTLTQEKKETSVVVVLHDLSLAAQFCKRLILMHQGSIVSSGTIKEVLNPDNLERYYKIRTEIDYSKQTVRPVSRIP